MSDLYCDICGKSPVRAQIMIEGAKMLACAACMRGGKILHRFEDDQPPPSAQAGTTVMESSEEIIEGYGKLIINARERLKLPISVVAERIREKESFLHAIEHERLMPTLEIARKLEKELGIKLVEKVSATVTASGPSQKKFSAPTLADMVDQKKKEK